MQRKQEPVITRAPVEIAIMEAGKSVRDVTLF
jgi:hypothetical protein